MISGHRKLFHDQMKDSMTLVAMAAFDSGSMILRDDQQLGQAVDARRVDQRARNRLEARLEDEDADDGRDVGNARPR